jgi:hypothetical protein
VTLFGLWRPPATIVRDNGLDKKSRIFAWNPRGQVLVRGFRRVKW